MANAHDTGYKLLFSTPELVRDLILGFVPDEWLHGLDYSTLERVPGADGRLPPVLPIVLYNGSQRWSAVTDVFDLIPPVPGLVEQFKPRLKYLLIDENAWSDRELASLRNLVAAVFRIEHPASPEAIGGLLSLLDEWLADRPDLRRMFALWIRATLMRKAEYRIVLPRIDDLQELKVMLAERLEEWAQAYKAEGKAEGAEKAEGEALALQKLLKKRFAYPPAIAFLA
jgi:hypothetical protein